MTNSHTEHVCARYCNKRTQLSIDAPGSDLLELLVEHVETMAPDGMVPLRFAIAECKGSEATVEACYFSADLDRWGLTAPPSCRGQSSNASVIVHVVPTSVGAAVGGFAGDASPATRLLAAVGDVVLTHPNVVNASDILSITPNTLYVEGCILDAFFTGNCALRPVKSNKIGVVIERQPPHLIDQVRYSIDAAHTTCGIPMVGYAVTKEKVRPRVRRFRSGAYTGVIDNIDTLLEAAELLVAQGASAIAVTTEVLDLPDLRGYVEGLEPNPHGGLEAMISHTISRRFGLPSAHAPMWGEEYGNEVKSFRRYDPREGAELVTSTAIGCVLQGLHKAPKIIRLAETRPGDLDVSDVLALVTPAGAIGSIPALACEWNSIAVITVAENTTLHRGTGENISLRNHIAVGNYYEAAGVVAALNAGIALSSVRRPIANIQSIS